MLNPAVVSYSTISKALGFDQLFGLFAVELKNLTHSQYSDTFVVKSQPISIKYVINGWFLANYPDFLTLIPCVTGLKT